MASAKKPAASATATSPSAPAAPRKKPAAKSAAESASASAVARPATTTRKRASAASKPNANGKVAAVSTATAPVARTRISPLGNWPFPTGPKP